MYSFTGHNYRPCVWNLVLPTVCLYDNWPQASWVTCGISLRYYMVSLLINLNKHILRWCGRSGTVRFHKKNSFRTESWDVNKILNGERGISTGGMKMKNGLFSNGRGLSCAVSDCTLHMASASRQILLQCTQIAFSFLSFFFLTFFHIN